MANRLSDDELRESLIEYGEDVGPITPTTRSAWERRLNTLRRSKVFSSRKITLNALSSDDSEIENTSGTHRKKRTSRLDSGERLNPPSHPLSASSQDGNSSFKKPPIPVNSPSFTVQGKKMLLERSTHYNKSQSLAGRGRKSMPATFDVETSDSDFDTDPSFSLSKSPRRTRRKHNLSTIESKDPSQNHQTLANFHNNLRQKPFHTPWNSNSKIRFQNFSPGAERVKREHANGYLSSTLSNGELSEERVEQGSSTNYSHCISWLLLFGTATFFIIIGVVYVTELQKTSQVTGKSSLCFLDSKFCEGVKEEDCEHVILISRELHRLLTTVAGIYDCATDRVRIKRNMTITEARMAMKDIVGGKFEMDRFDYLFNQSVILLSKSPDMGIKFYPLHEERDASQSIVDPSISYPDFSALEATKGSKSLWCRLHLSFKWTVVKILLLLCVGFIIFLCFVFTKFWKKRKEAQEKVFYEMVEKVIDILQETSDWNENESYKAVVKVRDAIIPAKERKEKLWLWDRVVAFIEENESRISVEYRTISGEDFKVWKWQPYTATENESGKQGKVWQGQAFSSIGKGKNAMYSLSPCLKIRNMFDSEVEYEEGWQVSIQDAILEKCEGNDGIRHIAVDTSTNEGCVYMLCSSTETAGKAFNDLHGWWFDGKLVTVKYIPYKRYLERFPESEHCTEALRPSNNKRLSLSTPFFSSALERS